MRRRVMPVMGCSASRRRSIIFFIKTRGKRRGGKESGGGESEMLNREVANIFSSAYSGMPDCGGHQPSMSFKTTSALPELISPFSGTIRTSSPIVASWGISKAVAV